MNKKLKDFVSKRYVKIAKDLVENPEGLKFQLKKFKEKLSKPHVKGVFGDYYDDFMALFRLIKNWASRDYLDISKRSLISIIVSLVYFITPTDFMPDFILGLGFLDDLTLLKWTLDHVKKDIEKYKKWEQKQKETSNE